MNISMPGSGNRWTTIALSSGTMPTAVSHTSTRARSGIFRRASAHIPIASKQTLILVQHPNSPIKFGIKTLNLSNSPTILGRTADDSVPSMFKTACTEVAKRHAEVWCKGKNVGQCYYNNCPSPVLDRLETPNCFLRCTSRQWATTPVPTSVT